MAGDGGVGEPVPAAKGLHVVDIGTVGAGAVLDEWADPAAADRHLVVAVTDTAGMEPIDATASSYKVVPSDLRHQAIQEYLAGEDLVTIGRRYGVSKSTVHRWVRDAGHPTRPPKVVNPVVPRRRGGIPAISRDAVALYLTGSSSVAVGAAFGVTPATVLAWVRRLGHSPRPCGPTPQPLSPWQMEAVDMYLAGSHAWQVADHIGVAPNTVLTWVRRAGGPVRSRGYGQVRRSPHPDAVRAAAVAAYRGGRTAAVLAADLGVSENTVLNWVRAARAPVRARGRRRPTWGRRR